MTLDRKHMEKKYAFNKMFTNMMYSKVLSR